MLYFVLNTKKDQVTVQRYKGQILRSSVHQQMLFLTHFNVFMLQFKIKELNKKRNF